jgi:two-component system phosphate regulon sensor histidine kinase PhoR
MKNKSATNLALLYSAVITLVVVTALIISDIFLDLQVNWKMTFLIILCCFIISFFILRIMLFSFIYNRIKLIYKTIHKRRESKNKYSKKFNYGTDLIKQVEKDVNLWATEQEEQMEQIIAMNNYRKEFVGNVAHELKTPIFNIQGYTLTLLEGGLEDETINIKYLRKIEKNINRMINIVNNLDDITKLEAGQLKLHFQEFNPVDLYKEVIETLEEKAELVNINIELIKHYDKPHNVKADKEFIWQVFTNVLANAIYYNKKNETVKIEFFEMGKNILIEVTDNGIGIPEEDIPRIFERFYRVDKSRSLNSGGSGLGLAIVKHIIEAHGQTVNIRSTVGVGTTIAFTLKIAK